ncbi:MAG TPA: hypothetical protein VMD91_03035 [Candidatus Sulfotelmatobacter sp.]|nr:hypothetical protein [Candidatus Sulfotelmatobacter sp.]
MRFPFLVAAAAVAVSLVPLAGFAQDQPPSYAQPAAPSYATQDEQIHGRIIAFDGQYSLQVRDDRGFVDNVQLHQGTIINPTGLTLAPGMVVAISGYNAGPFFAANEIDTPYTSYGGDWYYLGHPWWYYGPTFSLGFFFGGGTTWWHGGAWRGAYGGPRGYYGGAWRGRTYVAPPSRGGYVPHGTLRAPAGHEYHETPHSDGHHH